MWFALDSTDSQFLLTHSRGQTGLESDALFVLSWGQADFELLRRGDPSTGSHAAAPINEEHPLRKLNSKSV
jgi:hypothetical protein